MVNLFGFFGGGVFVRYYIGIVIDFGFFVGDNSFVICGFNCLVRRVFCDGE